MRSMVEGPAEGRNRMPELLSLGLRERAVPRETPSHERLDFMKPPAHLPEQGELTMRFGYLIAAFVALGVNSPTAAATQILAEGTLTPGSGGISSFQQYFSIGGEGHHYRLDVLFSGADTAEVQAELFARSGVGLYVPGHGIVYSEGGDFMRGATPHEIPGGFTFLLEYPNSIIHGEFRRIWYDHQLWLDAHFTSAGPVEYRVESTFLYASVPEPAAWAMMIVGFTGVGTVLRRRATKAAKLLAN